jgi:putative metalloprotease
MFKKRFLLLCLLSLNIATSNVSSAFDLSNIGTALEIGKNLGKAATLKEADVKKTAALSAEQMDKENKVAPAGNKYAKRLSAIVKNLNKYDGLELNYKVYLSDDVNAFAMPDGTVRVYSGLMDLMEDEELLGVMGHEIGHVKLKHSFKQMRKQLLTNAAFTTAAASSGAVGTLTNTQLGGLGYTFVNSSFSKKDELSADAYSVSFLHSLGKDPIAMKNSILRLQEKHGSGGGFLSSHPGNPKRLKKIQKAIDAL